MDLLVDVQNPLAHAHAVGEAGGARITVEIRADQYWCKQLSCVADAA